MSVQNCNLFLITFYLISKIQNLQVPIRVHLYERPHPHSEDSEMIGKLEISPGNKKWFFNNNIECAVESTFENTKRMGRFDVLRG